MRRGLAGTIGIVPAGALGVGFYFHLTGKLRQRDGTVFFLERSGSASAAALRAEGKLRIADGDFVHELPASELLRGTLRQAFEARALPEILLLCPNPDQLLGLIDETVQLIEHSYQLGEWDGAAPEFPLLVLSSNGIYFQRQRQLFVERLEESTLLGRLPDLWPDLMPRIVGRLLRGVTIQTGLRDGVGATAVYTPGPSGITRLAGGDRANRVRALEIFRAHGGWFEDAGEKTPTRVEFDKAMVNLASNLLGQIYAIDEEGNFQPLRVREIVTAAHEDEMRRLTRAVFDVGRAVHAYRTEEDFEAIFAEMLATNHQHDDHVPSTLQWVGLRLRQGKLEPKLTPTETWLIDPLIRYAHAAGLEDAAAYFEALRQELLRKLTKAAERSRSP